MAALKNTKSISMMLNLSPELNELLGASAKKSGRAKTTEVNRPGNPGDYTL